jgi:hypothetical protein
MMNKLDQAELLINKFKDILSEYKKGKCTDKLRSMTVAESPCFRKDVASELN